ncbi:Stp1/IreP family PP2C-type Ser/Thr phosphatase [Sedimentibacter sp. zth1]|uniref:Stp1/IreP family PP2C-type Ser/Thr phosphatase n=1 Tax=Sedimentibacter sp. zth1 TaxID=2816908 RepID=UPI001A92AB29|nr:Stp1/IreP family PP2C-type Ser/Thr phosphatase [Sedimentibacter sp. zth1]QSX06858.1 Stp1/IreP family PP2C-type Ser/Thr phosphatase [Sedimentibacter sp. zth1]
MNAYYGTNSGKVRNNNEDNLIVYEYGNYYLCVVADGMGGHKAGEIASNLTVETIKNYFVSRIQKGSFKPPKFIMEAASLANKTVYEQSIIKEDYNGMGTTVTMAVIDKSEKIAYIGNVGDSRTYLINKERISQITDDHTYVQELVKKGEITDLEAKHHSERNIITRAIGSQDEVDVDIFEIEIDDEDTLLLCSDGLTTHINDNDIFEYINKFGANCVDKLISLANENGGTDNITVIIINTSDRGETDDR